MKIYSKNKIGKLKYLGEGTIYKKSQIRLSEMDANLGVSDSIEQAQMKAKKIMNQNSSVQSASADAGKMDGQNDASTGEGVRLEVPVNATSQQLATARRMTKDQNSDDAEITFTKPNHSNSTSIGESRIAEMRKSAIPFTKSEMTKFLMELNKR